MRKLFLYLWVGLGIPLSFAIAFLAWELSALYATKASVQLLLESQAGLDDVCDAASSWPRLNQLTAALIASENKAHIFQICEAYYEKKDALTLHKLSTPNNLTTPLSEAFTKNAKDIEVLQSQIQITHAQITPITQALSSLTGFNFSQIEACESDPVLNLPRTAEDSKIVAEHIQNLKKNDSERLSILQNQVGPLLVECLRQEQALKGLWNEQKTLSEQFSQETNANVLALLEEYLREYPF